MKIGVMGGVFDPPHLGHKRAALYLINNNYIDNLTVIPCYEQPLKKHVKTPFKLRYEMTQAMFNGCESIRVSDIEYRLPKPSYTINTIHELMNDTDSIYLIIGYDEAEMIHKWHRYMELRDIVRFILINRDMKEHNIDEDYFREAIKADNEVMEISSTDIRSDSGHINRAYIDECVYNIIKREGLYSE